MDPRPLGSMGGEHLRQRVGQSLQQLDTVGHRAGRRSPEARRLRGGRRASAPNDLHSGMCRHPLGHGRGFSVGEEGQRLSPFQVQ